MGKSQNTANTRIQSTFKETISILIALQKVVNADVIDLSTFSLYLNLLSSLNLYTNNIALNSHLSANLERQITTALNSLQESNRVNDIRDIMKLPLMKVMLEKNSRLKHEFEKATSPSDTLCEDDNDSYQSDSLARSLTNSMNKNILKKSSESVLNTSASSYEADEALMSNNEKGLDQSTDDLLDDFIILSKQ